MNGKGAQKTPRMKINLEVGIYISLCLRSSDKEREGVGRALSLWRAQSHGADARHVPLGSCMALVGVALRRAYRASNVVVDENVGERERVGLA